MQTTDQTMKQATEQAMNQMHTMTEKMSETWLNAIGNLCWAQDQVEKIVKDMVEQGKVNREEGRRLADRVAAHVRENQDAMQKWVNDSVKMSMAAFHIPTTVQVEELQKKIDELTHKVETLSKK